MNIWETILLKGLDDLVQPSVIRDGHTRAVVVPAQLFVLAGAGVMVFQQVDLPDADIIFLQEANYLVNMFGY